MMIVCKLDLQHSAHVGHIVDRVLVYIMTLAQGTLSSNQNLILNTVGVTIRAPLILLLQ